MVDRQARSSVRGPFGIRRELWVLIIALPLGQIADSAIPPVLPGIRDDLGLPYFELGIILAMFGVARVAVSLPMGMLMDRFHPRRLLLAALVLSAIGALLGLLATQGWQLAAARLVTGAATGAIQAVIMAWLVAGAIPALRGRVMSAEEAMFSLATMAAPLAAGALATVLGWRVAYGLGVVSAVIAVGLVMVGTTDADAERSLPRPAPAAAGSPPPGLGLSELSVGGPLLTATLLATFAIFFGRLAASGTLVPILGSDEIHASPAIIGLAVALGRLTAVAANIAGGWLGDRRGRSEMLLPLLVLLTACNALPWFMRDELSLVVLAAAMGLGYAIAPLPPSLVGDALPARLQSRGVVAYRVVADASLMLAPLVPAIALEIAGFEAGRLATFAPSAVVLALVCWLRWRSPRGLAPALEVSAASR